MTTFVLVHGAWHGAWCWDKLVPELESLGHRAVTLDLPGAGDDTTPIPDISLASYVQRVVDTLDAQDEKVVLVGHSAGGVPITAAAEMRPEKIRTLVYLTAFLPKNGQVLSELEELNPRPTVTPAVIPSEDGLSATLAEDKIHGLFFHDCSEEDAAGAIAQLTPLPLCVMMTPVSISDENFGSVPRCYIECLDDQAILIEMQRKMVEATPCGQVLQIDTSHSPFLSRPAELAQLLTMVD